MSEPMRILVYPHAMEMGGSQLNAIELAAAVRDRGHDVTIYSEDGPLVEQVRDLGLSHIRARRPRLRPSPSIAHDLARIVREQEINVLHGYEWPPALEMYAAAPSHAQVATVCTVMSMAVAPFIPARMPLVVGTERIRQGVRLTHAGAVHLLEPPVDTDRNRAGCAAADFRAAFPDEADIPQIVIVSRLVPELKLEGILSAIRVADQMAAERKFRLVIVGDGAARAQVEAHATEVNVRHQRTVVLLTGALADPRGAYDAADICIGMGGSALRALAFGKPLVVQGESGFFETLTRSTVGTFLEQGWYGIGEDANAGAYRLRGLLTHLLDHADERAELGEFGLRLVTSRFSLTRTAVLQEQIYREALAEAHSSGQKLRDGTRSVCGLLDYKVRRRLARLGGEHAKEDFNARPL